MNIEINGHKIRKWCEFFEETITNETGVRADDDPIRKFAVGVILKNPYSGKFSKNSLLTEPSEQLGKVFGERVIEHQRLPSKLW